MKLRDFFTDHPRVALAFSGGVDSAYLLWAAQNYGARVKAYYVMTAFQPRFEYEDACRLARETGAEMETIHLDILSDRTIINNPSDRCYHCKKRIFTVISASAKADGFTLVIDGTNASDEVSDRPGMKALEELSVRSPLRECGLTKDDIRKLSRQAGLFTWNKSAYACLATRIPTGTAITAEALARTEQAEDYLKALGFTNFRIRQIDGGAKIQLPENQLPLLLSHRRDILSKLRESYKSVLLDLEVRP